MNNEQNPQFFLQLHLLTKFSEHKQNHQEIEKLLDGSGNELDSS